MDNPFIFLIVVILLLGAAELGLLLIIHIDETIKRKHQTGDKIKQDQIKHIDPSKNPFHWPSINDWDE